VIAADFHMYSTLYANMFPPNMQDDEQQLIAKSSIFWKYFTNYCRHCL